MPKEIRDIQKLTIGSRHYWTYSGLLLVAVLMIAGTYFEGKMKAKNPEGEGAVTASRSPLRSETPLLIKTKTATATSTKKATKTYTLMATFTATATKVPPTPTLERLHLLDTPISKDFKFVIHRIADRESVAQYAELYNTTAEAIYASNLFIPSPIWINWLIIIPVDMTDVADLPAFEAYMVDKDGIIIEEVAETLSVDAEEMRLYNDLETGHIMNSGDWLLIPREHQENN